MKDRGSIFSRSVFRVFAGFLSGVLLTVVFYSNFKIGPRSSIGMNDSRDEISHETRSNRSGRSSNSSGDSHYERSVRYANRETKKAIERGFARREIAPSFNFIGDDGEVTREALDQAGVPMDRAGEIQKSVDELRAKAEKGLKARIYVDEEESDKENGVTVYRIPADRAHGDQMLFDFEEALADVAGRSSARILMEGLHPTNRFGWYGKLDLKIAVIEPGVPDEDSVIKWTASDPSSGKRVCGGECLPGKLSKYFGGLFETK